MGCCAIDCILSACVQWWASLAARYSFMNVKPLIRKCVLAFAIYAFATGISVAIPDKSAKVQHRPQCLRRDLQISYIY